MEGRSVILLLPPQFAFDIRRQIEIALKLHGLTQSEEIEPKAGCRRFRLT